MLIGGLKKEKLKISKIIKDNQSLELNISKILKKENWKSKFGWIYIKFKEPSHNTVFLSSEYNSTSIIFDHAF